MKRVEGAAALRFVRTAGQYSSHHGRVGRLPAVKGWNASEDEGTGEGRSAVSDELLDEAQEESTARTGGLPNPHLLAYDFFKHMTSLSILTLGGMLTLSGSVFENALEPRRMVISMASIAASGFIAFAAQTEMVDWAHRGAGRPKIVARWGRGLIALTYGVGVGAFLSTAHEALT